MSKYKIEPWPPQPNGGMQTGKIPAGVKVTDTETGYWHYCNIYRSQHQNKDSAIKALQAYDRSKRGEPLIRLVDYQRLQADHERLQAECEQLRKHLQNLIDQTTPLEPEPGNPMWSRRIQLDEVIAERDSLRAECDQLRKDAERYRWLRDPCSGAERVVTYGRGDYGRGLMSYTMLDGAIDSVMHKAQKKDDEE